MKPRILIIVLAVLSLIMSSGAAPETREPKIDLKQALAKAEKYVVEKKIDVSTLYMSMIYRSEFPKNSKQNCWTIIWAPKDPNMLDGELRVYIYDDGRIEHGGSA
ncbi:MAG TPA: hypothetical protein VIK28_10665 [Sedimentisphaerales bacterium]